MSMNNPRIVIVGSGAITEEYYLPALASFPSVMKNLILVDKDRSRLEKFVTEYKIENIAMDYRDIVDNVDGVIIALPTGLHSSVGVEFLSRKIPVLCEKPLAEDAVHARTMVDTAHQNGTALAVNYLQRMIPHFAYVKQLLKSEVYGRPLRMDYVIGEIFNWPTVSGFYFRSDPSTRGILRDRGAHAVDHICWWLGGKPELISSYNDSFGGSEAVAHIEFEKDLCKGKLIMSWFADVPCRFSVECEGGILSGDIYDYQKLIITEKGKRREVMVDSPLRSKVDVAREIVSNFINVIVKNDEPLVSGVDVLPSIVLTDEAYNNAKPLDMPWYMLNERENGR